MYNFSKENLLRLIFQTWWLIIWVNIQWFVSIGLLWAAVIYAVWLDHRVECRRCRCPRMSQTIHVLYTVHLYMYIYIVYIYIYIYSSLYMRCCLAALCFFEEPDGFLA